MYLQQHLKGARQSVNVHAWSVPSERDNRVKQRCPVPLDRL